MKGYTKDEIVGENFSKFYLPEAVESGWPQRELALAPKRRPLRRRRLARQKRRRVLWASVKLSADYNSRT